MKKALLSLSLAVLLIALLVVPAVAESGDVMWKLSNAEIDAFCATYDDSASEWIQNCGGGTKTRDGNSMKVSDRKELYDTIDIRLGNLDPAVEYTIVVTVHGAAAADYFLGFTSGPWDPPPYLLKEGVTKTTLTYKMTPDNAKLWKDKKIRIQQNSNLEDFWIDGITIYEGDPPADAAPKTGDSTMIALAVAALVLAAGSVVFFTRKVKA